MRGAADPVAGWERWCAVRRELCAQHPQSPIPEPERAAGYGGPHVWPYDPAWRLLASVEREPEESFELPSGDGATMRFVRFARARTEHVEYQPSCSYVPRRTCPLALPANRLEAGVRAGERRAA